MTQSVLSLAVITLLIRILYPQNIVSPSSWDSIINSILLLGKPSVYECNSETVMNKIERNYRMWTSHVGHIQKNTSNTLYIGHAQTIAHRAQYFSYSHTITHQHYIYRSVTHNK